MNIHSSYRITDVAPSHVFPASGRMSGSCTGEVLARIGGETRPG